MKMRLSHTIILSSLISALALSSCGKTITGSNRIMVFAGAGAKSPLQKIGKEFTGLTGIEVLYDFQGSGSLLNKINSGVLPDMYIPAAAVWVKKCKKLQPITMITPLVYHIPVVVYNPRKTVLKKIQDLTRLGIPVALAKSGVAAIGNSGDIILKRAAISKKSMHIVAYAFTVKQLIYYVKQGHAAAAIVWRADAIEEPSLKYLPIPQKYTIIEQITLCVMDKMYNKSSNRKNSINRYVAFMLATGLKIFKQHGFTPILPKKNGDVKRM